MEIHRAGGKIGPHRPTLVLGIGNLLMGDEGIGVHAIELLKEEALPHSVQLLDGGTGGFHLLSLFHEYDPIVLIDATTDGSPPGTVSVTRPRFASDFPRTLSAHDIGLRDLLETASLLAPLPELILITISIAPLQGLRTELSPDASRALPEVARQVRHALPHLTGSRSGQG